VRGAYQADGGVNLRFGTLWSESLRFFWRATGLGFLLWAPLFALLFIVFFGYLVSMDISPRGMTSNLETFLVLSFISFCCCMVPLILVISFFQRQALSALVVEDIGVFDCLARAWNVITKRFGELFIMGLIMFGIGMVVGLVLATPVFVITIPLMTAFLGGSIRSWIPFLIAFMLLLAYSPISWFLSGIYRTFSESAWTLTYMRLTQKSTMGDGLTSQTDNPQNPRDGDKTILATPNA